MSVPNDSNSKFGQYAHGEKLVSTDWLADHLDDPDVVVVESDEDVLLYDTGHIPGAIKVDCDLRRQINILRRTTALQGLAS